MLLKAIEFSDSLTLIRDDSTVTGVCKWIFKVWMQSTTFQQFVFVMLMQECSIFCHISHITFLWYLNFLPGGKNSRVKWKLLSIVTFRDFWLLREKYWNDSFFELRIKKGVILLLYRLKVTFFRVKQCTRPNTNYQWEVNDRGANCHRRYCLMQVNPRQSWILDYTLWIPNRPFARWHHFTKVTRILFVFLFIF